MFSALEGLEISNVDDTWGSIRASAKVGGLETNWDKSWFDWECSELANKRTKANLLWLQNRNDQTAEDFIDARRETCRIFRKKKLM